MFDSHICTLIYQKYVIAGFKKCYVILYVRRSSQMKETSNVNWEKNFICWVKFVRKNIYIYNECGKESYFSAINSDESLLIHLLMKKNDKRLVDSFVEIFFFFFRKNSVRHPLWVKIFNGIWNSMTVIIMCIFIQLTVLRVFFIEELPNMMESNRSFDYILCWVQSKRYSEMKIFIWSFYMILSLYKIRAWSNTIVHRLHQPMSA